MSTALGEAKYATLSHCWGTLKLTTLKKENISAFQHQIPDSALSQTFRDAIDITRYLSLRYLWIDSLCIVQDDAEDWATESSLMSDVYSGSHINLAASGAKDGSVGCFFTRTDPSPVFIRTIEDPNKHSFFNGPAYIIHPSDLVSSLVDAPLSSRAWSMQERFLPSRTIYFTRKEIFWECCERFACQSDPCSPYLRSAFSNFLLGDRLRKENLSMKAWAQLVQRYSTCKLTKQTDRLVAISGIARAFERQLKDFYLCGLWRNNLEMQLCWGVAWGTEPPVETVSDSYVAPSWSWASCGTAVDYFDQRTTRYYLYAETKIVDFDICYATADVFGQVLSASLYISCIGFTRVNITYGGTAFDFGARRIANVLIHFDWKPKPTIVEGNPFEGEHVYILPLVIESQQATHNGLILLPTGRKSGQYRRVGEFRVTSEEWGALLQVWQRVATECNRGVH
ncbi:hypothetical protein ACEPPN_005776 [Leptodophora sp. 'Broadleaf-Isolate-01']